MRFLKAEKSSAHYQYTAAKFEMLKQNDLKVLVYVISIFQTHPNNSYFFCLSFKFT